MNRHFWTDEKRSELRRLAALGMPASEIGLILGATKPSVITTAGRANIDLVLHTEAEIAVMVANRVGRQKRRKTEDRKKAVVVIGDRVVSKTSSFYRKLMPTVPEMTKNELRAILTQAVRNTVREDA